MKRNRDAQQHTGFLGRQENKEQKVKAQLPPSIVYFGVNGFLDVAVWRNAIINQTAPLSSPGSPPTSLPGTSLLVATIVLLDPAIRVNGESDVGAAFELWVL